jgi:molybdopterin-containing oxidoreductase family membrane subunit
MSRFDPGRTAIQALTGIAVYGLPANLSFLACKVFVVFYSRIAGPMAHFQYLYAGLDGHGALVPWKWTPLALMAVAAIFLIVPATRGDDLTRVIACADLFTGTWIDKGTGLLSGEFIPTPLHGVMDYVATAIELIISPGIHGIGTLILTILFKIDVGVRSETEA